MASRGRGSRGCPRGSSRPPPSFDQQAFVAAMGAAANAIAQASAVEGKEGPSNLQLFIAHHPPTFTGGGDPVVLIIGFDLLRGFWRLWRLPPMLRGSS